MPSQRARKSKSNVRVGVISRVSAIVRVRVLVLVLDIMAPNAAARVAKGPIKDAIAAEVKSLVALAKLDPEQVFVYDAGSDEAKEAAAVDSVQLVVQDGVEVYLPLSGLIDPEKERKRLEKQSEKINKEIQKLAGRLQSKGFVDKAPAAVVDKAKAELAELEDQAAKIQASLEALP